MNNLNYFLIILIVNSNSFGVKLKFDISIELSTSKYGSVFLLVRFLFSIPCHNVSGSTKPIRGLRLKLTIDTPDRFSFIQRQLTP